MIENYKILSESDQIEECSCNLGGDYQNNCEGCVYNAEYKYDPATGDCVLRMFED